MMIKVRTRKPHRRKTNAVRIRHNCHVLVERKVRKLLEVRYTSWGIFYLVELQAHKTITNLRRYHRSSTVSRFGANNMILSGVIA